MSPSDLIENPELGALAILKKSLEVAHLALVATYPDCEPSSSEQRLSAQEAFAISILNLGDALLSMIEEYRQSVQEGRSRRSSDAGGHEF